MSASVPFEVQRLAVLGSTLSLGLACLVDPWSAQGASTPATESENNDDTELAQAPRIEFKEPTFDFGEIPAEKQVTHRFEFKNTGTATLEIERVQTSCGCTTAGEWDRVVEPGASGSIPIQFNPGRFRGKVLKTVTVFSNDPEHRHVTLRVGGSIWTPLEVVPRSLVFQYDSGSSTGETKIAKILSHMDEPLKLSAGQFSHESFKVELEELKPGKEFALRVTTVPPVGTGTISAPITLKTSLTNPATLSVQALAVERQPILVSPSRLYLSSGPLKAPARPAVTIRSTTANPLSLSEPTVNLPGIDVALDEVQPGRLFRLTPSFPEGFELQATQRVSLTVKTSHPRRPLITIPVVTRRAASRSVHAVPSTRTDGSVKPVRSARRPVRVLPLPQDTKR
jgi:hypothetical protein